MNPTDKTNRQRMEEAIRRGTAAGVERRIKEIPPEEMVRMASEAIVKQPFKPKKRPDRSPRGRDAAMAVKGRLPDGSHFEASWLIGRGVWVGMLAVPKGAGKVEVFRHQASGLFQCLSELDDKYRAWLSTQTPQAGGA